MNVAVFLPSSDIIEDISVLGEVQLRVGIVIIAERKRLVNQVTMFVDDGLVGWGFAAFLDDGTRDGRVEGLYFHPSRLAKRCRVHR